MLNPDEKRMANDLSDAEVSKILAAEPGYLQLQTIGEMFDDERFERLGVDLNAQFAYENIIEFLKNR